MPEEIKIQMPKCSFLAGTYSTELIDQDPVGITRTLVLIPDWIAGEHAHAWHLYRLLILHRHQSGSP